jgi:NAD+ diphosphatase
VSAVPRADRPELPPLSRSAIDRAAHLRRDPQALAEAWERGLVLVIGPDDKALVRDGKLVLLPSGRAPKGDRLFLGIGERLRETPSGALARAAGSSVSVQSGEQPYFAIDAELVPESVTGEAPELLGEPVHLWQVGDTLSDFDAGLFTEAVALVKWHRDHLYSPQTGEKTEVSDGGWVRRDPDGGQHFPRTDVAAIVLVHDGVPGPGGRALLGSNAMWQQSARPRYSTLAGFVEPGESAEAGIAREVKEEVGVDIFEITYVCSQPWPFPRSLMLGYLAKADPDAPITTDPSEIVHARWFTRAEIEAALADPDSAEITLPMRAAISQFLISRWLSL